MLVKCISTYPSSSQLTSLGEKFFRDQSFLITTGKTYLVLGLSLNLNPHSAGQGLIFQVEADDMDPSFVPACLFQIVDPKASRYWALRVEENTSVHLWPPSFYGEYYHDDLSERVKEVVNDYRKVVSSLRSEAELH